MEVRPESGFGNNKRGRVAWQVVKGWGQHCTVATWFCPCSCDVAKGNKFRCRNLRGVPVRVVSSCEAGQDLGRHGHSQGAASRRFLAVSDD